MFLLKKKYVSLIQCKLIISFEKSTYNQLVKIAETQRHGIREKHNACTRAKSSPITNIW